MAEQRDYASIVNAMIEKAKEIGAQNAGNDVALACYQIINAAIDEAEVWGVSEGDIGLGGYQSESLLSGRRQAA